MSVTYDPSERLAEVWNADLPAERRAAIRDADQRVRGGDGVRRVLLIGGSGYIGGPVTHELLRTGYTVRNLDLNLYANGSVPLSFMARPDYEFVRGDLADPAVLDAALDGVSDVVLLGGLVGDPITKAYPDPSQAINDDGVRDALERMVGRGLNKVIFVSTCSNYGLIEGDALADEHFELNPLSLYAKAKVAAERRLLEGGERFDYNPTVLRFATAFGLAQRMRFDLTVNEFTRALALGEELLVYDAHTWRPYCHVKDFARLIRRVLEFPAAETAFDVFNAGGEVNNHTKQSIVDTIVKRLPGAKVAYKEHGTDPRNYRVDFSKVRERLLFEPAYSVGDGVDEILRALGDGLLDDVDARRDFYGNYTLDYPPARSA